MPDSSRSLRRRALRSQLVSKGTRTDAPRPVKRADRIIGSVTKIGARASQRMLPNRVRVVSGRCGGSGVSRVCRGGATRGHPRDLRRRQRLISAVPVIVRPAAADPGVAGAVVREGSSPPSLSAFIVTSPGWPRVTSVTAGSGSVTSRVLPASSVMTMVTSPAAAATLGVLPIMPLVPLSVRLAGRLGSVLQA